MSSLFSVSARRTVLDESLPSVRQLFIMFGKHVLQTFGALCVKFLPRTRSMTVNHILQ